MSFDQVIDKRVQSRLRGSTWLPNGKYHKKAKLKVKQPSAILDYIITSQEMALVIFCCKKHLLAITQRRISKSEMYKIWYCC